MEQPSRHRQASRGVDWLGKDRLLKLRVDWRVAASVSPGCGTAGGERERDERGSTDLALADEDGIAAEKRSDSRLCAEIRHRALTKVEVVEGDGCRGGCRRGAGHSVSRLEPRAERKELRVSTSGPGKTFHGRWALPSARQIVRSTHAVTIHNNTRTLVIIVSIIAACSVFNYDVGPLSVLTRPRAMGTPILTHISAYPSPALLCFASMQTELLRRNSNIINADFWSTSKCSVMRHAE